MTKAAILTAAVALTILVLGQAMVLTLGHPGTKAKCADNQVDARYSGLPRC